MISGITELFARTNDEPRCFRGKAVVLMADTRDTARLGETASPTELINHLNRITTGVIKVIESHDGVIHMHVGGCFVAYWPPSNAPDAVRFAILAASDVIAKLGCSVSVSIAFAECALLEAGPAKSKKPSLVGKAYNYAAATLGPV